MKENNEEKKSEWVIQKRGERIIKKNKDKNKREKERNRERIGGNEEKS